MNKSTELPSRGKILISEPSLHDGFFGHSVVLLVDHNAEGSFGFVVNKPSGVKLHEVTSEFGALDSAVFLGGPVMMDNLYYLHRAGNAIEGSVPVIEGLWWGGNIDVVKDSLNSGKLLPTEIRFFVGYSGWSPKQLDRELKEHSWVVKPADLSHVWTKSPKSLWKNLVLSLGDEYALWINHPDNPYLN